METQIIEWIGNHVVAVLLVLSVFIQIAPIKINPWSSLIKWIGKTLNSRLQQEILKINNIIKDISSDIDQNEKDRIRWQVLDFASSCREGRLHTKDEFQHIIALNDKYKKLLAKTDDKNGVFDEEYKYIQEIYHKRQQKNGQKQNINLMQQLLHQIQKPISQ